MKALAHHLKPVVLIGANGLTPAVLAEIDRALTAHELIKVGMAGDDREARRQAAEQVCSETGCVLVQAIGKQMVFFRAPPAEADKEPRGPHQPKKQAALGIPAPTKRVRRKRDEDDDGERIFRGRKPDLRGRKVLGAGEPSPVSRSQPATARRSPAVTPARSPAAPPARSPAAKPTRSPSSKPGAGSNGLKGLRRKPSEPTGPGGSKPTTGPRKSTGRKPSAGTSRARKSGQR